MQSCLNTSGITLHRETPMQCSLRYPRQHYTWKNPMQYLLNNIWSLDLTSGCTKLLEYLLSVSLLLMKTSSSFSWSFIFYWSCWFIENLIKLIVFFEITTNDPDWINPDYFWELDRKLDKLEQDNKLPL